jgi:hypothetical protein
MSLQPFSQHVEMDLLGQKSLIIFMCTKLKILNTKRQFFVVVAKCCFPVFSVSVLALRLNPTLHWQMCYTCQACHYVGWVKKHYRNPYAVVQKTGYTCKTGVNEGFI